MQNNFREVTFPQVFPLAPSHTNQLNLRSSALAQQDLKFFFFFFLHVLGKLIDGAMTLRKLPQKESTPCV